MAGGAAIAAPQGPFPYQIAGLPINNLLPSVVPLRRRLESAHVPPVYTDLKVDPPTLKAALTYLTSAQPALDACGQLFQVYLDQIQAGRSQAQATLAAAAQYERTAGLPRSAACVAAEQTWRREYAHGRDPLLPAARPRRNANCCNTAI